MVGFAKSATDPPLKVNILLTSRHTVFEIRPVRRTMTMIENRFGLVIYNSNWLISKSVRPNVGLASKVFFEH